MSDQRPFARELLGFEAKVRIEDGLPELVEWVAAQIDVTERGDEALEGLPRGVGGVGRGAGWWSWALAAAGRKVGRLQGW